MPRHRERHASTVMNKTRLNRFCQLDGLFAGRQNNSGEPIETSIPANTVVDFGVFGKGRRTYSLGKNSRGLLVLSPHSMSIGLSHSSDRAGNTVSLLWEVVLPLAVAEVAVDKITGPALPGLIIHIPQDERPVVLIFGHVTARREQLAVRAECHTINGGVGLLEGGTDGQAGGDIPEADCTIVAGGRHGRGVWAKSHAPHGASMSAQKGAVLLTAGNFPKLNGISVGGGKEFAVRAEGHAVNKIVRFVD